ncbi:MAG: hypothetical protein ACFCU6_08930, partial [Balneolaceae bacterium]
AVWQQQSDNIYKSAWFWFLILFPVLTLAVSAYRKKLNDKLRTDSGFARAHRSLDKASQLISEAREQVNSEEPKQVYSLLHKAVSGYIADKLKLPEAGLSDRDLIDNVQPKVADSQIVRSLKQILDKCATISYAPVGTKSDMRNDIDNAEKLIHNLQKKL